MSRRFLLFVAISIPVYVFMNINQAFDYQSYRQQVLSLEDVQKELIQQNKLLVSGISVLRSPSRVEPLALGELELGLPDVQKIIKINIRPSGGIASGQ